MEPVVSIIVPIFNTREYLTSCLDSLLSQNLKNIEIICVDNGSSDGSDVIARDFASREDCMRYLSHPYGRQGGARNAGLSIASGNYVGFVDSDDICHPEMFSRLLSRAEITKADISICNIRCFDNDWEAPRPSIENCYLLEDDGFTICERPCLFRNLTICNRLFRRRFLEEQSLEFPEALWHEDQFFVGKALFSAERIVTVPDCLYYYRKGRAGSVGAHTGERHYDLFVVMAFLCEFVHLSSNVAHEHLMVEVRILRHLSLYAACGPRVRRGYYARMRMKFREIEPPQEFKLLKRSEVREFRAVIALGYFGYSVFLQVRKGYGALRCNFRQKAIRRVSPKVGNGEQ